MAAFQKFFHAIDKNNTGVITSVDLRNYMQKMKYKENFVTTWTSLFDPEHTGIITYEKYCKVLGLKQEDHPPPPPPSSPPQSETGPNTQPTEPQIQPKDSEPVKAEPVMQDPGKLNSENSESQCQRNTESVSKEGSSLDHPKSQEPSNGLNSKSSSVKAIEQPKEVSAKRSRKRKYSKSPSKESVVTPITSKSNVETDSPENCGLEVKSEPMNLTVDPQATESITSQKVEQPSSEKPYQKSKVDKSGKVKNKGKDKNHKTLGKSIQESPEVESKPEGTNEDDSGADIFDFLIATKSNPIQTVDEFSDEEPSRSINEEITPEVVEGESDADIFDFLIATKSNPIQTVDEFSDEGEVTPEMVEPTQASKSKSPKKSEAKNSPKPVDERQEKCKESKKKRKPKPSKSTEKEPSDGEEQPEDSGMDVFDFLIGGKDIPMDTTDDFDDQPLDTVVSEIVEHTMAANPALLHESEKDKPDQRTKSRSRKVSEKSECKSPNAVKDISSSSQEQQESGGDIFDWLIETQDHPMATIDDEDMKLIPAATSEKSIESKSDPLKNTEKSEAPESGSEDVCKGVKNISEASEGTENPLEPTVSHVNQAEDISEEQSKDAKYQMQISESSKFEETKELAQFQFIGECLIKPRSY
nr:Calcium binding EF handdomain containing protein [Hymenolepis microstoma]